MKTGSPLISFVVVARNDNYGGDFLTRLQIFVKVLIHQLNTYKLDAELVIVEWNPPADRPRLKEALSWPPGLRSDQVRIIEVPPRIHQRLPGSERTPVLSTPPRNTGLRRAEGKFILVTNPDILFSNELISALNPRNLSEDSFYRVDRYDFKGPLPLDVPSKIILKMARKRIYAVHFREDLKRGLYIKIGPLKRLYSLATGKWPGSYDPYRKSIAAEGSFVELNDDTGMYNGIHTNASGDFLLAHRDNWAKIRGFPEFSDLYQYADGYGCFQLRALGLKQKIFIPPCMILHMDHGRTEKENYLKTFTRNWTQDWRDIWSGRLGPAINAGDWGLGNEGLPEIAVAGKRGQNV